MGSGNSNSERQARVDAKREEIEESVALRIDARKEGGVIPCSEFVTDPVTEQERFCGSTGVSRLGYCMGCGAYRAEYDQEVA